jgi:hypothetical protein
VVKGCGPGSTTEKLMTISNELIGAVYILAQLVAGLFALSVFILLVWWNGFDSTRTSGNRTEVLVGAGLILATLVALILVGPLFVFDQEYAMPEYPTEFFKLGYGIVYCFILMANSIGVIWWIRRIRGYSLLIPVLGLVTASWVTKTIGVMIFVYGSGEIGLVLKVVAEAYCFVMAVFYFAASGVTVGVLTTRFPAKPPRI